MVLLLFSKSAYIPVITIEFNNLKNLWSLVANSYSFIRVKCTEEIYTSSSQCLWSMHCDSTI